MPKAAFYVLNGDGEGLQLLCSTGFERKRRRHIQSFSRTAPFTRLVLQHRPILEHDGRGIFPPEDPASESIQSAAVFPLVYKEECAGCLLLAAGENGGIPVLVRENLLSLRPILADLILRFHGRGERAKRETRYRNIIESIPVGLHFYELKPDGRLIFTGANRSADRILGVDNSQFIGKTVEEAFPALSGSEIPRRYREAAKNGKAWRTDQVVYEEKDIAGAFLVEAFQVSPQQMAAAFLDITDRKRIEKALEDSERQLRTLHDNLPVGVFRTSVDGRLIAMNQALVNMFGYESSDQLLNQPVQDLYQFAADRDQLLEQLSREETVHGFEARLRRKDGTSFWGAFFIRTVEGDDGDIRYLDGLVEDITAEKQTAEAILNAKLEWEGTFDALPELIMILDEKHIVRRLNRAMWRRLGMSPRDAVGRKCFELLCSDSTNPQLCPVREAIENPETGPREIQSDKLGGQFLLSVSPVSLSGRFSGVVVILRDINDAKRMEAELLKAQKLESLGFLAGGIAHDFNNILAGILVYVELAKRDVHGQKTIRAKLEKAEKAILRARNLTQQLLTFSQGGAPVVAPASIKDLLEETVAFVSSGSSARYRLQIEDDLWDADVDSGQISQVVQNLIINADQAMSGGGTIHIRAANIPNPQQEDPSLLPGRYVKISVEDHGSGIPSKYLQKVFDPFFTTKSRGSGLGLSTAYSIVRNHGGQLTLQSEPGRGSVFNVYLKATGEKATRDNPDGENVRLTGLKLMLMDDDATILQSIGAALIANGARVVRVRNGKEAVKAYQKASRINEPFDVVILDLTIAGGMGGKETIRKLRAIDPEVTAVVSSGYSNDPIMADYREHGFSGMLSKPYRVQDLARLIATVLNPAD